MKIFYKLLAVSVLCFPAIASADTAKMVKSVRTAEYITCAAFFAVLAHGMRDKPDVKSRFDAMSEKMMDRAISLSNEDYAGDAADERASKMLEEMKKGEPEAKAVVRQHISKCKVLIDEVEK